MSGDDRSAKVYALHLAVLAVLFALNFVLPAYYHGLMARIMVLAVFAMGYNVLFGYAGLLSLGHAMFFAAGMYGTGLTIVHFGFSVPLAFVSGIACGAVLAFVIGLLALRTSGVAFMIVTMMFAQVFALSLIYFAGWTGGDQGLVIPQPARILNLGAAFDLTDPTVRYMAALALFAAALFATLALVRSRHGRVLVAIRENEERTKMLGYDTFANKLAAVTASGTISAAAGAAFALLFGYVGANFAGVQYSILPLLWVLLGGAATTLGPLLGTLVMYVVTDTASSFTSAWLLIVGVVLILLVLFFPKGILGTLRARWLGWLP
ncbi:branched-chain amino acid ABC transporter permease [Ollibium composti]|uniref:Branched-chain amino acid ABC transporter permease n=1 Tax=Ollibium composti TaxID=2675109 RepID=A0ABY2QCR7_9HYPH|nr:branched-chain amino acid ABC transporter permease [Mesorhizobium composti]THF58924.1 branched-chain amino acid ABC transporter permease [Mesorhizobium composti]